MSRRGDADRAAASIARIGRLEEALRAARKELWDCWHSHMSAAEFAADPVIEQIDAALARPMSPKQEPADWLECSLCGGAYYGIREGCLHKDPRCPMKGKNP